MFNDIKDGNGKEGVIGTPPTDERVDLLRELLDGLVTDEGIWLLFLTCYLLG